MKLPVLDLLFADLAPARHLGGVIRSQGSPLDNSQRILVSVNSFFIGLFGLIVGFVLDFGSR